MNNKTILETLKLQPLTEEEKASRHILGRWYGPIATCNESTRNGRRYNRELWEKALNDELFHEKIANKCLFLELGHPQDREETDMSKVCACIPEMPKIIDGDLCACVDILDTPNGRILKTLCDYGFIPGVSSRGSGDVMPNNDVDPETFYLETFDCVAIPAVKRARGVMCESLDKDVVNLKKALTESINKASEEDKAIMKETLENLDIDIEASEEAKEELIEKRISVDEIPWDPEEDTLVEEIPANTDTIAVVDETNEEALDELLDANISLGLNGGEGNNVSVLSSHSPEIEGEEKLNELLDADIDLNLHGGNSNKVKVLSPSCLGESTDSETQELPKEEVETVEEIPKESSEEVSEEPEEVIVDVDSSEEAALNTVADAIEQLQEYDDDTEVQFEPIKIDGKEYNIDKLETFVDEKDNILVVGVNCEEAEKNSDDTDSNIETKPEETSVEAIDSADDENDSADGTGDEEVIESLKEIVRQKEALETEVSDLRKAKSVGDAKELELQEKLNRYRTAFRTTSAEAARVPELEAKVKELTEQLTQAQNNVKTLTEKVNKVQQLKESIEGNKANERRLTEEVSRLTERSEALEAKLEGQTKQYTTKLQERTNLAKKYKARFIETLTRYVESKASMLGVKSSEITSRLNESYTLADVDAVCDEILDSAAPFGRLPFGGRTKASARITESVSKKTSDYDDDDDLSSLYELAGLTK